MTDLDICGRWLEQAWVELKAPLGARSPGTLSRPQDAQAVQAVLQALCRGDLQGAHRACSRWHPQGAEPGGLTHALALILPVIEHIERDWQADRRGYDDTLYAFWNVQRFLQGWGGAASARTDPPAGASAPGGRLLMASGPGCQHHLGTLVVADHFRSHGWQVQTLIDAPAARLVLAAQQERPDVIGLSVGHDGGLVGLADLIRSLRAAVPASPPRIVLGGHAFEPKAAPFDWLGADGIAHSAQQAWLLCRAWMSHPRATHHERL